MKRGAYAGSFDPPTIGHLWMIQNGAALFDELVVAVGINPEKKYQFPAEERVEMLRESARGVRIETFNETLAAFARSIGAKYLLRGIRSTADSDYERVMRNVNGDLDPEITTVFLMPPRELAEVSSSLVKGLMRWPDAVRRYVPEAVFRRLYA